MARQSLLVVDADQRSLSVLEVSLRNAGYNVAGCASMARAFEVLEANQPDLILSDTELEDADGFTFVQRLRQNSGWSEIPFMFLSSDGSIESKIRGLELGVQDYLTKPIYIREVVARVGIELSRHERDDLTARAGSGAKTRFSGSLSEMSVVDLLQTIDVSRKTGVLYLVSSEDERGAMFFDAGAVIHAHVGDLKGDDAVYRLLLWSEGSFDLEFRRVREGEQTVQLSTQALLMEGMHRLDQWGRLHEQLPSPAVVLEVDGDALRAALQDLPDEKNELLRLIDGERAIGEVLQARGGDRLETLRSLVDLYFEGIVREIGTGLRSIAVVADPQALDPATWAGAGHDTIPGPAGTQLADPYRGLGLAAPPAYSRNHKPTRVGFEPASIPGVQELGIQSSDAPLPAAMPSPLSVGATTADAIPAAAASRNTPAPEPARRTGREVDHTPLTVGAHQVDEASWASSEDPQEDETILRSSRPPQPMDRWELMLESTRPSERAYDPEADGGFAKNPDQGPSSAPEAAEADGVGSLRAEAAELEAEEAESDAQGPELSPEDGGDDERETMEFEPWDTTLNALQDDPDVSRALEEIEAEASPAPFVRSIPPASRDEDPSAPKGQAGLAGPGAERGVAVSRAYESESPEDRRQSRRRLLLAAFLLLGGAVLFSLLLRPTDEEAEAGTSLELEMGREAKELELAFEPERVVAQVKAPAEDEARDDETTASGAEPLEAGSPVSREDVEAPRDLGIEEKDEVTQEEAASQTDRAGRYETQLALARQHKRGTAAVEAYQRAIEINPEGADALAELAFLMLERGRNTEAAELSLKATEVDPSSSLAWVTLGSALQYLNDEDGAMNAYRNCIQHGRGRYVAECRAVLR